MYSFEPNEEQQMLLEAVGRFAENDLRPAGHDAEEEGILPEKVVNKGWELGLLQASVPEEYGGFGERSAVTGVLAVEEMACGDLAGTLAVNVPSLFVTPILLVGSEELWTETRFCSTLMPLPPSRVQKGIFPVP